VAQRFKRCDKAFVSIDGFSRSGHRFDFFRSLIKAVTTAPHSGIGQIAPAATSSSTYFHSCGIVPAVQPYFRKEGGVMWVLGGE
jgi:hypothetical protein